MKIDKKEIITKEDIIRHLKAKAEIETLIKPLLIQLSKQEAKQPLNLKRT